MLQRLILALLMLTVVHKTALAKQDHEQRTKELIELSEYVVEIYHLQNDMVFDDKLEETLEFQIDDAISYNDAERIRELLNSDSQDFRFKEIYKKTAFVFENEGKPRNTKGRIRKGNLMRSRSMK